MKRLRCERCRVMRASAAYTLVELVVTMVLAGILAAVAMPRIMAPSTFTMEGYADELTATLQYARKAAIAKRRYVCVAVAGNGVTLTYDSRALDPDGTASVSCGSALELPSPSGNCSASNVLCTPGDVTVSGSAFVFDPRGRPVDASRSPLTADRVITTTARSITIAAETGHVH
jgi:MSHA pilin protein MshC